MSSTHTVRPSAVEAVSRASEPECPRCHCTQVSRMPRMGWREKGLYAIFGYYPWRCAICRTKIYLRKRSAGRGKVKEFAE